MKRKILNLLKVTAEEYDDTRFRFYLRWCMAIANYGRTLNGLMDADTMNFEEMEPRSRFLLESFHKDKDECALQHLLANTALSKYFDSEYEKCEAEFLSLIGRFSDDFKPSGKDAEVLYVNCTFPMFGRYSKPLIEAAKRLDIYADNTN